MDHNLLAGIGILLGASAVVGVLLLALERVPGLRATKDVAGNRVEPRAFGAVLLVLGPIVAVAEALQGEWGHSIVGAAMLLLGLAAFVRSGARQYRYVLAALGVVLAVAAATTAGQLVQRLLHR